MISYKCIHFSLSHFDPVFHRCVDCQSRYFDCEFDQNENEKTDGGLGAGNGDFNYGNECFAWNENVNIVALICGFLIETDDFV